MQEFDSSEPPVVPGICDPNKSRAQHHHIFIVIIISKLALFIYSFYPYFNVIVVVVVSILPVIIIKFEP